MSQSANPPSATKLPPWSSHDFRLAAALLAGLVFIMTGLLAWLAWSGDSAARGGLVVLGISLGLVALITIGVALRIARTNQQLVAVAQEFDRINTSILPKLSAVWEKAPMSILLLDGSDPEVPVKIIDCNPMACQIHGYTREELIGQCIDILEATPWATTNPNWIAEYRKTACITGTSEHRRKDGTRFWIDYCTGLVVLNGREIVIGMDREASARIVAEKSLRTSEERWQLAVAGSNEGGWDWNISDDTIWYSARWKSILGFAESELPDRRDEWLARIHPDDRMQLDTALKTHLRQQAEIFHCEYRLLHKDGSWIWALVRGKALFNAAGRAIRMVGTQSDITRQKEGEAELRQAKESAEMADRAKSEFLAVMSHEIRTPMNGVLGFTNLLLDTPLGAEQRDWLLTIRSSGESLLTLINDILDFSKIESGRMEFDQHPVSVRRCVEEVLDLLWSKANEKKIELLHWIDADVPEWVLSDSTRLRQVLVNLVGNAIKFTTKGEVEVRIALLATEPNQAPQLSFSIRDTGEGIPTGRIHRLFRPFSQADSSTTRKHGGTGLGLAISRSLAQLLGGDIELISSSSAGSCFRFTIRATITTAPADQSGGVSQLRPAVALDGRRALIIDDNECNRRILTCQLQRWGIICESFEFPAQAIEHIRTHGEYDLAILDMMMPEMHGVELAAQIHQLPGRAEMPLILLSSVNREELRVYNPMDHFRVVLTKPVRQSALLDALNKTLGDTRHASSSNTPPAALAASKFDPTLGKQHPLRIIVAEDNLVNQKLIAGLLRRIGYQPQLVGHGLACIEALRRDSYNLILMDCQMPEMDGLDATARIRNGEAGDHNRDIRIVALTASAMVGDREICLKAGMNDYLTKPIQAPELIRMIRATPAASK